MKRSGASAMAIVLLAFLLAACGKPPEVGSDKLTDFDEQEDAQRLGQAASPLPSPPAGQSPPVAGQPAQKKAPAQQPAAQESFFDVTLVGESPYYEPGNELSMPVSATIRVTNRDTTAERQTRNFKSDDGSFDSGPLKPGQVWTHRFSGAGSYRLTDPNAPFIFGSLQVR